MIKITLLTVGKIKEKYFAEAIKEYSKRLSRYCKLEIIEVADEKTPDNASKTMTEQIKNKEGDRLLRYIKSGMYVISLALDGKTCSSTELASKIERLQVMGNANIAFIIGGSLGLSEAVLNASDEKISFSEMTFPHQLMRVILLEQIYRVFKINANEPYHK